MITNKYPSAALENYSRVMLELGLVLSLFIVLQIFKIKSYPSNIKFLEETTINEKSTPNLIEIKIEQPVQEAKAQPVIADRIVKVEDNANIKESVILSTESDEKQAVEVTNAVKNIPQDAVVKEEIVEDVPFVIIEKVPIFPGCSGNNDELRKCFSDQTSKFITQHFNTNIASDIGLESGTIQKIFVVFRIDKNGNITDIKARAPQKKLEDEAIRVVKLLPKMTPGMQRGNPVGVSYGLPIAFKVQ